MIYNYFIFILCLVAAPMMAIDIRRLWSKKDKESRYRLRYLVLALLLVIYLAKSTIDNIFK